MYERECSKCGELMFEEDLGDHGVINFSCDNCGYSEDDTELFYERLYEEGKNFRKYGDLF
jgi:DNA-directed RNA polymerase subunit M/transcription elongation factor TFIIS